MAKRLTRKKLKQKDEFITTAEKLLNVVRNKKSYFIISVIVILFLLIFSSIGFYYYKDYSRRGSIAYTQALQLYEIASRTHDKKDISDALKAFENFKTSFKFLNLSKIALLYIGGCQYMLGDYDNAIQSYKTFISTWVGKSDYISAIAYNGLIETYIAKDDCNTALRTIDDMINKKDNPYLSLNYVQAVDCYIKMGQAEKAEAFIDTTIKNNINNKDLTTQLTNLLDYIKKNNLK